MSAAPGKCAASEKDTEGTKAAEKSALLFCTKVKK